MRTIILILTIIFILFSNAVFAQKQTPASFVQSFYKFHRARSGNFESVELKAHQKWFSADLNRLFQNELKREEEFIKQNPTSKPRWGDGLPFVPLEDCYKKGKFLKNVLKIGRTSIKKNKMLVEVKFYYPKACEGNFIHAYKFELVKNKESWLINDLIFLCDNTQKEEDRLSDDLKRVKVLK